MTKYRVLVCAVVWCLVIGLTSVSVGMKPPVKYIEVPDPLVRHARMSGPFVIVQKGGGVTWVQPHQTSACCPGDPNGGHGGEATGMPEGPETWCFENPMGPGKGGQGKASVSDTCGCNSPWDVLCFDHIDVRGLPSQMGINFWHIDDYLGGNETPPVYLGDYALWCGSDSLWIDGYPVECASWPKGIFPGYGDQWHCVAELALDTSFHTVEGCTLYFDPRYDTECKYDYFYVDFFDGSEWVTLASFNASSGNPGAECGSPTGGNPDYWGNTDSGQPFTAVWQPRMGGCPAFMAVIQDWGDGSYLDYVTEAPAFRWRFASDPAWSDADGRGNTDGACFIDNVWVACDNARYEEDFEGGPGSLGPEWTFPNPDLIAQCWHQTHDPDPPYEGADGGDQSTCLLDSSIVWRGRPEGGYPAGEPWRNGWFYRLMSPAVPIMNTGCLFQYDIYLCTMDYTCDYMDTKVRFHDSTYNRWCIWHNIDGSTYQGGCKTWLIDFNEDVTPFYDSGFDSVMFCWDLMDLSNPGDFCRGKHKSTDFLLDNVSVGFYDSCTFVYRARQIDLLTDTFHDSLPGYNSFFDAYDPDTLGHYGGYPYTYPIPKEQQFYVSIVEKNQVADIRLYGSIDWGATWINKPLTLDAPAIPGSPELGGDYYGTFLPTDFSLTLWDKGTDVWYYVWIEDGYANIGYFPAEADPGHEDHTGTAADYFAFSILPMAPPEYSGPTVLLVDGAGGDAYDYASCMASIDNVKPLDHIYKETLRDAGYCFDTFDIGGAGSNIHLHPLEYDDYDAVVWFTGPDHTTGLFDPEAQEALRDYLDSGGKVVLCGDRIAYNMASTGEGGIGEDSLYGEFLNGIMGCDYKAEMEGAFEKPYLYAEAAPSINVFGTPTAITMDTLLVYRECPYLKDMSYVVASSTPDTGYSAQSLLYLLNADLPYDPADMAIYVEKAASGGQCVFVDFDLSASVNHMAEYCDGSPLGGVPSYDPGLYAGRVELMRTVLEDLFGIPSWGTGSGGEAGALPGETHIWALGQNSPNPFVSSTAIRYDVARAGRVSIRVYNAMGQLVKVLEDGRMEPGTYSVSWDGTNRLGRPVAAGVYFYAMEAGGFSATRKALVLSR